MAPVVYGQLGRRPRDEARYAATIALQDHLIRVPEHPLAVDDTAGLAFGMDGNDLAGVCVPAGWNHLQMLVEQLLTGNCRPMTLAEIQADYRTQNPLFSWDGGSKHGPGSDADGGMSIGEYLSYLQRQGRILGYAKVDHTNRELVKAAIYLGLALIGGYDLQAAQREQDVFDYVPGSGPWGGHCMDEARYRSSPERTGLITWGTVVDSTAAFERSVCDELYFVITQSHVEHPDFRVSFNLTTFAAAFEAVTGRPFPVHVTPDPGPVPPGPVPAPPPAVGADQQLAIQAWRYLAHHRYPRYLVTEFEKWLAARDL